MAPSAATAALLTPGFAAQAGGFFGLLSWALYWNRGEHHLWTAQYAQMFTIFPILATILGSVVLETSRMQVLQLCLAAEGAYILAVWTNMLVYRAFFHRLHRFPGPFAWKLSKFVQAFQNRNFENYKIVDKLHKQYGDYVRTGPTELHIVDPDAINVILSSQSRCARGPWYEMGRPLKSMLETRIKKEHDSRRRARDGTELFADVWAALRDYEPRVDKYVNVLARRLADFKGEAVNVSKWFNYFSFDVMGDLAFAHSFDMLETGKQHEVIQLLEKGQQPLGFLGMLPWLFNFLTKVPGVSADYNKWLAYCEDLILERQKIKVDKPDIAHWLLDYQAAGHDSQGPADDREWLRGDSRLVVVAGSDTTAAGASFCFYRLCEDKERRHVQRIREELATLERSESNTFNALALQNDCPYLNAFISETLRLHPPVPGGFQRQTPPEGITITSPEDSSKAVVIPGGVNMWMPLWTIARSEKCYTQPLEFAPERWLPEESPLVSDSSPKILRKEAFLTFSMGPMGCVGKGLALQELRMLVAVLLDRFEPSFAAGEDGSSLVVDSRDWFTLGLGHLMIQFKERKA